MDKLKIIKIENIYKVKLLDLRYDKACGEGLSYSRI